MERFDHFVNTFCSQMMKATVVVLRKQGVEPKNFDTETMDILIGIMRQECKTGIEAFLAEGKRARDLNMVQLLNQIFAAEVGASAIRAAYAFKNAREEEDRYWDARALDEVGIGA